MYAYKSNFIPIKPFDATKDYEFIFYINGGNQILRNNLIIEKYIYQYWSL